jgi:hypothetical protein
MPMIDLYAAAGTFSDMSQLAKDLAATLMAVEGVPDIPMFRKNTAAFVHELPPSSFANVDDDSTYVRWGLWGHAHLNGELVTAARAEIAKLQA